MNSGSDKSPSRQRSKSKGKPQKHKMFVTNLDVTVKPSGTNDLKAELDQLFNKYGTVQELSVKKAKKGDYKFAFVQYKVGQDGQEAIRNLNGMMVKGKAMKVQLQDDSKRRKDPDIGCYICDKKGHFARQCRFNRNGTKTVNSGASGTRYHRSRSRSSSQDRKKKRKRRSDSESSEQRSRHKKDRKHNSKQKIQKKKKKHKKNRNKSRSSSGSMS